MPPTPPGHTRHDRAQGAADSAAPPTADPPPWPGSTRPARYLAASACVTACTIGVGWACPPARGGLNGSPEAQAGRKQAARRPGRLCWVCGRLGDARIGHWDCADGRWSMWSNRNSSMEVTKKWLLRLSGTLSGCAAHASSSAQPSGSTSQAGETDATRWRVGSAPAVATPLAATRSGWRPGWRVGEALGAALEGAGGSSVCGWELEMRVGHVHAREARGMGPHAV